MRLLFELIITWSTELILVGESIHGSRASQKLSALSPLGPSGFDYINKPSPVTGKPMGWEEAETMAYEASLKTHLSQLDSEDYSRHPIDLVSKAGIWADRLATLTLDTTNDEAVAIRWGHVAELQGLLMRMHDDPKGKKSRKTEESLKTEFADLTQRVVEGELKMAYGRQSTQSIGLWEAAMRARD